MDMKRELHFSNTVYGTGAGIFFIGYSLFDMPSNLLLRLVGTRLWIARIMITWGIVAACMMFVHSPHTFYALRFLLGVAHKIAEINGILAIPPVREMLGQMAAEASMVEGLVESMEISGSHYGKYFVPNGRRLYAAMVLTQQLYPK